MRLQFNTFHESADSMRIAVALLVLAASVSGPALAQEKIAAKAPSTAKAASPVKPSLSQLAAEGDVQAQFDWGQLLLKGAKGVKKNPAQAQDWLALAASNGHVEAAIALAQGFEKGLFGKADMAEAANWWYRAGDLGNETARQRFLTLYLDGQTASVGGPAGVRWLEQQAATNDNRAILALGRIYEFGDGIVVDHAKAQAWYRIAALSGNVDAQYRLGSMLLAEPAAWRLLFKDVSREKDNTERDNFYPTRDAAQTAAGNDRWVDIMRPGMLHGEYWLTRAALRGHPQAALTLGEAYLQGRDLPFDLSQAVRWLSVSALAGEPRAMKELADLAAMGQGLFAPDPIRAWVNYDLAAAAGMKEAEESRDKLGKTMNQRQLNRSRQIAADLK
ncbi:MAG: sel1 repeat family protein [Magnetospirillum gryphiswaldense]|nr:sel1 repeat family protein [Magnetospirillum gryphiswaldense]